MAIGAKTDFETIIDEIGETVNWHVNTKTSDSQSGDEIESFGSATAISSIIVKVSQKDIHNSAGEITDRHYWMFTKSTRAISIKDKIVRKSTNYTVDRIETQAYDTGTLAFQKFMIRRLVDDA